MLKLTREKLKELEEMLISDFDGLATDYVDKTVARTISYVLGTLYEGNFERAQEFNKMLTDMSEQARLELRIKGDL